MINVILCKNHHHTNCNLFAFHFSVNILGHFLLNKAHYSNIIWNLDFLLFEKYHPRKLDFILFLHHSERNRHRYKMRAWVEDSLPIIS